jgi:HSP20 family molecular chaperone IbpA
MPGVKRNNVKIDLSGMQAAIRGNRNSDADCGNGHYDWFEGHRGRFQRVFLLPEPVDRNWMQVELKNGVLRVVLPKAGRHLCGNS